MPTVKILKDFSPVEGWEVGDVVDITDPWELIKQGYAVLVDTEGNEIERPGAMICPVCTYSDSETAVDLATHIFEEHPKKGKAMFARVKKPGSDLTGVRMDPLKVKKAVAGAKPKKIVSKDKFDEAEKRRTELYAKRKELVAKKKRLEAKKALSQLKKATVQKRVKK